jgi:cold shock CspA family protein
VGKVKWFNNKSGYGFITFIDSKSPEKDIFAHHSSLNVKEEIYKYLVQGEYVEFEVQKMTTGEHEYQAVNIKGIGQNDLMCETRHKNREVSKSSEFITVRPKRGQSQMR